MSNLKADLDKYLSGSGGGGSGGGMASSLSKLTNSFTMPTLKSPFSSSNNPLTDDNEMLLEEGTASSTASNGSSSSGWFGEAQDDGCCPSLSKKQRIIGFMTCLSMGVVCFVLASLYIPVLLLYTRKFALLFSLGSVFTLGSFSLLWGPMNHLHHLFGQERLPFTAVYLTTLVGTLYFAMGLQSTLLTLVAGLGQVVALLWFVVSYIPGGQTGLKFFSKMCSAFCRSTVNRTLPV